MDGSEAENVTSSVTSSATFRVNVIRFSVLSFFFAISAISAISAIVAIIAIFATSFRDNYVLL